MVEVPRRGAVISAWREQGGGVAAVYPIHHPRALWRGFGLLPVEVWGPPISDTSRGDARLQAYTCSVVRCGLAFLETGALGEVELIVVPHACDSLQGLGSLLIDFAPPPQPVITPYIPRTRDEAAVDFLAAELRGIGARLAEITGRSPSAEELLACVQAEERADAFLVELWEARRRLPLDNLAFYRLVRSREYLPAERFEALAASALAEPVETEREGPGLLLSGLLPEPMSLLEVLDRAGAVVVLDDYACSGRRHYPAGASDEPYERMAQRLLGGPPDPTLGHPIGQRVEHLASAAASRGVQAALFHGVKFCEPERFDLPLVRKGLEERLGIPCIDLEVDLASPLAHQAVTRVEALLEGLS
jgi:benzoyl-CoA reductase/2-hydroxyglutaryl-CoA dehydratase subunit BcrC/BadD/HgdB